MILFVCYGGGHVKSLIPLIKEVDPKDRYVLGLTTSKKELDEAKIKSFGFLDLLKLYDDDELSDIENKGKVLADDNSVVSYDESVAYLGISYRELVTKYGFEKARLKYESEQRSAFLPIDALTRLINNIKASLVVTTVSPRAEQASIIAAHRSKIPSVCINDFINENSINRIVEVKPTVTCVVSTTVKSHINSFDSTLDVRVTGNPAFDRLVSLGHDRRILRHKYDIRENDFVILWAAQKEHYVHPVTKKKGDPNLPRLIEEKLNFLVMRNEFIKVILRPHPNDSVDFSSFSHSIDGSQISLDQSLVMCDAVLTISSTVGYEALLMGKKLFTIEGATINDDGPYRKFGMSISIESLDRLEETIVESVGKDFEVEVPKLQAAPEVMNIIRQLRS